MKISHLAQMLFALLLPAFKTVSIRDGLPVAPGSQQFFRLKLAAEE